MRLNCISDSLIVLKLFKSFIMQFVMLNIHLEDLAGNSGNCSGSCSLAVILTTAGQVVTTSRDVSVV